MKDSVLTDYVGLFLEAESQERFTKFLIDNKFTEQEYQDSHITIIYSETRCDFGALFGWTSAEDISETILQLPKPLVIEPFNMLGYDMFGKDNDYFVLKLEHPLLHWMNKNCRDMGGTMSFPDYRPHITIEEAFKNLDKDSAPKPDFNLIFDKCQVTREFMVSTM